MPAVLVAFPSKQSLDLFVANHQDGALAVELSR